MRVVIDTNVLASGIFWKGTPSVILENWVERNIQVFVTLELLKEYQETLEELDRTPEKTLARHWLFFIAQNSTIISPKIAVKICRDPDDDKILDCAISAGAKYVVSGDKDLLSLGQFRSVEIVPPSAFLKILTKRQH